MFFLYLGIHPWLANTNKSPWWYVNVAVKPECCLGYVLPALYIVCTVRYILSTIYIYIHIQIPCAGRSKSHDTAHHCPPSLTRKKLTLSNCQRSIDLKDCQHHFNTTHKFDSKKCLARSKSLLTNQALPSQPRWRKAKIFLRVMTGLCSQDLVEEVWPLAHWHLQQSLHFSIVDGRNPASHLGSKT